MKILECSTVGDVRFSPFYAKVEIDGVLDTIENHYQTSKVLSGGIIPDDWRVGKSNKAIGLYIRDVVLDTKYLTMFYNLMWYKYLMTNPDLVEVLSEYDGYSDKFSKGTRISQDRSITMFMQDRISMRESFQPLVEILNNLDKETRVVNKKYDNYDVYIGRGSIWGNPYELKKESERDKVIDKYERRIRTRPDLLSELDSLRGKRLGCYCSPKRCHGDVLIKLIEEKDNI